jgi:hypothetical protein
VIVSEGSGKLLVNGSFRTNDAAEGACCEVVAAEELDLLLRLGEGRSHDVCFAVVATW